MNAVLVFDFGSRALGSVIAGIEPFCAAARHIPSADQAENLLGYSGFMAMKA